MKRAAHSSGSLWPSHGVTVSKSGRSSSPWLPERFGLRWPHVGITPSLWPDRPGILSNALLVANEPLSTAATMARNHARIRFWAGGSRRSVRCSRSVEAFAAIRRPGSFATRTRPTLRHSSGKAHHSAIGSRERCAHTAWGGRCQPRMLMPRSVSAAPERPVPDGDAIRRDGALCHAPPLLKAGAPSGAQACKSVAPHSCASGNPAPAP